MPVPRNETELVKPDNLAMACTERILWVIDWVLLVEYLSKLQKFQFSMTSFNFAWTISAFVSMLAITWLTAWEEYTLFAMLLFSSMPPFLTGCWQNNYSKKLLTDSGFTPPPNPIQAKRCCTWALSVKVFHTVQELFTSRLPRLTK